MRKLVTRYANKVLASYLNPNFRDQFFIFRYQMQCFSAIFGKMKHFLSFWQKFIISKLILFDYFFDRKNFIEIFLDLRKGHILNFTPFFKSEKNFGVKGSKKSPQFDFRISDFWWCESGLLMSITFMSYSALHESN